jgi:hypothetical protein
MIHTRRTSDIFGRTASGMTIHCHFKTSGEFESAQANVILFATAKGT